MLIVRPLAFMIYTLKIILHESSHAATAWLLAPLAVPQFDLQYGGGGVTPHLGRQPVLVVGIYVVMGYLAYLSRDSRRALVGWAVVAAVYAVAVADPTHDLLITAMGHAGELVFAALFLNRALSGTQILTPVERPLYAMLGCYLVLIDVRFAVRLIVAGSARTAYGDAMGGGHRVDFDRLAATLHCPFQAVAAAFLLARFQLFTGDDAAAETA